MLRREGMARMRKKAGRLFASEVEFVVKRGKAVPHEFVLDALTELTVRTRPMFGCLAVYAAGRGAGVEEKIVLVLREKPGHAEDNGVWLATTVEHHESLRREFPNMRSIGVLGKKVTGWQILPVDAPDFEESALRACELIARGDPRIGKAPKAKKRADRKGRAVRGSGKARP
jgi:hypothetical protein